MEFFVFDIKLNRLGIIDDYITCKVERHYTKNSFLTIVTDASNRHIDLLKKGNILVRTDDLKRGYIIQTREYTDEYSKELEIIAPSLNILLNDRIVLKQQTFSGDVEEALKWFVFYNAIAPENPNRAIPKLILSDKVIFGVNTSEVGTNVPLDTFLYQSCNKHDISWDIFVDLDRKEFIFDIWQGADRTYEQNILPRVVFSKDRENVLKQNFVESDSNYKNVAIVYSRDEVDNVDVYVTVNDTISLSERREVFIDADDIKRRYTNEFNQPSILSGTEFRRLLEERGKSELTNYQKITTFDSEIDLYSDRKFDVDFFMGDKVSIISEDMDIILHTRIISSVETVTRTGKTLQIEFGSNVPKLRDILKKAVS